MADNFQIMVIRESKKQFELAMRLAFDRGTKDYDSDETATGYSVSEEYGLILYKYDSEKATPLPYPLKVEEAIEFVWGWLKQAEYPPENGPSPHKGFKVYNEQWGMIGSDHSTFIAIKPYWTWYGK